MASFDYLTRAEKVAQIQIEHAANPDEVLICLGPAYVQELLDALKEKSNKELLPEHSEDRSRKIVVENWGDEHAQFEHPLPLRAWALLAILSEMTPAQGALMRRHLDTGRQHRASMSVNKGKDIVLGISDINKLIRDYAGFMQEVEDEDDELAKEKQEERFEKWARQKKEKKNAAGEGAADDVLKGPADKKLDAATAKLEKSDIGDKVMPSSEDEDDEL